MFRLFALLFLILVTTSYAHNWMLEPEAYPLLYRRNGKCRGIFCKSACQRKTKNSGNSRSNPAKIYRRGQKTTIVYTKNNHRGGFLRVALVPVDKMMDMEWHKRMTIMQGCWESGTFKCSGKCGSDSNSLAYKREITIPDIFPDGDYVLGYLWYGGIKFDRKTGRFGEFYSCSFVRVQGGAPLSSRPYTQYFEPGNGAFIRNGECQTSADDVGQCALDGCDNKKTFFAIPRIFRNGKPAAITSRDVAAGFGKSGGNPSPGSSDDDDDDDDDRKPQPRPNNGPRSKSDEKGRPEVIRGKRALCRGPLCCPASCGACGGFGCGNRPGGYRNCCKGSIRSSGRRCSKYPPPCKL